VQHLGPRDRHSLLSIEEETGFGKFNLAEVVLPAILRQPDASCVGITRVAARGASDDGLRPAVLDRFANLVKGEFVRF
jgi:hypothetical protein